MTDGPEAEVGEVLEVKFPRPRERQAVLDHPDYYQLRAQLIYLPRRSPINIGACPH